MAVSSIFADFTIDTPEKATAWLHALEESERLNKLYADEPRAHAEFITDPDEIRRFFGLKAAKKKPGRRKPSRKRGK